LDATIHWTAYRLPGGRWYVRESFTNDAQNRKLNSEMQEFRKGFARVFLCSELRFNTLLEEHPLLYLHIGFITSVHDIHCMSFMRYKKPSVTFEAGDFLDGTIPERKKLSITSQRQASGTWQRKEYAQARGNGHHVRRNSCLQMQERLFGRYSLLDFHHNSVYIFNTHAIF
jgi:hypothetical protein